MSKKTLGLIIILLLLTIVLVFVAISTKQQPSTTTPSTPGKPTATPTPVTGHTTLMLSPNPVTASRGVPTTVNVMIDSHGDSVRAVQLEIAYDPRAISNVTIKPGTFFPTPDVLPIGGVNQTTGRITFAVTEANSRDFKSGQGTVAVLTFYPTGTVASTPLTLLDKSLVTSPGMGAQSVLKSVMGTTVTVSTTQAPVTTQAVTSPTPIPTH
jgi:hypothetical protein